MKKVNRIRANEEFAGTIKLGRNLKNSSFVLCYKKNEFNYSRIGISVPTKLGNAVTRVTIRRQIRAMFDLLFNVNEFSVDIVIIVRNGYLDKEFQKNKDLLNELLLKIGNTK